MPETRPAYYVDNRPKPKTWQVERILFKRLSEKHLDRLDQILEEGWEPFAVTPGPEPDLFTYHLRRLV